MQIPPLARFCHVASDVVMILKTLNLRLGPTGRVTVERKPLRSELAPQNGMVYTTCGPVLWMPLRQRVAAPLGELACGAVFVMLETFRSTNGS